MKATWPIPESREVEFEALDSAAVLPVIGNWNQLTDAVGKEVDEAKLRRKHCCTRIDEGNLMDEAHSGRSRSDDHWAMPLGPGQPRRSLNWEPRPQS